MADGEYDYLVVGATQLAGLLATQLALVHGKRICLVTNPFSPFRLERSINLSVGVVTRPDTLGLLKRTTEETLKHLAGLGKGLTARVDPLFVAETAQGMAAVAHFRHLALALGYAIEQIRDASLAEGTLCRVRGACTIPMSRLAPALEAALARQGATILDRSEASLTLKKDGTARIATGKVELAAAQTILADDEAILAGVAPENWDKNLVAQPRMATLVEAARPFGEDLVCFLDRDVVLRAADGNSLTAIVCGDMATAEARLAASARRSLPLRRAGEARFSGLATLDGIPVASPGRSHKAWQIAGFGAWGAFIAPAIARMIVGSPTPEEEAWFTARRNSRRTASVDYAAVPA